MSRLLVMSEVVYGYFADVAASQCSSCSHAVTMSIVVVSEAVVVHAVLLQNDPECNDAQRAFIISVQMLAFH